MDLTLVLALIGVLGVGSQWLAVRLQMPAIVFMLVAGILAGPVFGLLDPKSDFGELFKPIVAVAVALILFEGGLSLNFRELRDAAPAVRRLCTIGALLTWLANSAAGHYIAGLSWPTSLVFGGILVVTGPTVVMPLLRQARLASRTSSTLRWEAIVNDPVGALLAVLAFEVIVALQSDTLVGAAGHLGLGIVAATVAGWIVGRMLTIGFRRGLVSEYMKAPVLFACVLGVYAATDWVLHESGLLAVTVMGLTMANARLPSLEELRRFKEHVTVLLVSAVFVILAATLKPDDLFLLDYRGVAFIAAIMLLARPFSVFVSLIGTQTSITERAFIAWIAPRGVVAVAISGFFGDRLVDLGYTDAALMAPLAFALVAVTVVVYGFSVRPLARTLGLRSTRPPGVIILGGNDWTTELATEIQRAGVPALMVDRDWHRLGKARARDIPTWYGEILSESAHHSIDMHNFGTLIAAGENDDYNTLVCTDVGPEFGRDRVFQVGRKEQEEGERDLPATLGGRSLMSNGTSTDMIDLRMARGWGLQTYDVGDEPLELHPKAEPVLLVREGEVLVYTSSSRNPEPREGDQVIVFTPHGPHPSDSEAAAASAMEGDDPASETAEGPPEESPGGEPAAI